jgi:UDP-glucose 4-epimerase
LADLILEGAKVLVTGGAGFIGSELVRQLANAGASVTVIDNLINGKRENLNEVIGKHVSLEVIDIRDFEVLGEFLEGMDVIYHLACLGVRHSIHDPEENHQVNASATLKLLNLSKNLKVGRFVYVSTSEVYGTARYTPMTEQHPTMPHTVYGGSKLAGECYARAFFDTYKYNTVIVRPFNAFGPRSHHEGDSGEVIPKFMLRAMAGQPMIVFGDGNQTRDFTFVGDTARGILLAGFSEKALGQTINLGQGKEISVRDLADKIRIVTDNADAEIIFDEPRPGDVFRLFADSTKARELLGFVPVISLEEGLEKLCKWYGSLDKEPSILLESEVSHNWLTDED